MSTSDYRPLTAADMAVGALRFGKRIVASLEYGYPEAGVPTRFYLTLEDGSVCESRIGSMVHIDAFPPQSPFDNIDGKAEALLAKVNQHVADELGSAAEPMTATRATLTTPDGVLWIQVKSSGYTSWVTDPENDGQTFALSLAEVAEITGL